MRGLIFATLGTALGAACAFGALGVALYGDSPHVAAAGLLYAGFGFAAGGVCGVLDLAWHRLPASARGEGAGGSGGLASIDTVFRTSRHEA